MRWLYRTGRLNPMVLAVAATASAAGLVVYLQQRATAALESHAAVILRQVGEQAAADVADDLRRTLDGPVFDTLTAVNHPELRAGRLDLVAAQFDAGLRAYPHVDRFFAWLDGVTVTGRDEVAFYGRDGRFSRDPELGKAILDLARRHAHAQQIYVAADGVGPGSRHEVFLRLFWEDARRETYFAVLGFVVDPATLVERLFDVTRRSGLEALLTRRSTYDVPLKLRVLDEHGGVVFGPSDPGSVLATVPFTMSFYPVDDIQSRLAAGIEPGTVAIQVTASGSFAGLNGSSPGPWPTLLSIGLMLLALAFTAQAYRRSEELARMQRDFVAHVSHQLKTPLAMLSTASETLQLDRVRSPEKLARYLGTIHGETARLNALVQRVLEFSRMQEPRRYEFERVDLGALVRETVEAFAHGLSGPPVTFHVEEQEAEVFVRADSVALEQVLVNLLDNAVKYSDSTPDVTVRTRRAGTDAVIEVVDHGIGIDAQDRGRIFERFFRGSAGRRREGFGLGLSIVQELVEAHRGRVEVDSVPGRGSTFRVVLRSEKSQAVERGRRWVGRSEATS